MSAYKLQDKAKVLKLEELQSLEEKASAGDPEAETTLAIALHMATLLKRDDAAGGRPRATDGPVHAGNHV